MGRRRKRLIIQADITGEEDRAFVAWILERRKRRRLADEIREGLRLLYQRQMGTSPPPAPFTPPEPEPGLQIAVDDRPPDRESGSAQDRLKRLVGSF
ncbi:MAG: hypothetical protein ACOY94_06070 [Bacillota bacterium]